MDEKAFITHRYWLDNSSLIKNIALPEMGCLKYPELDLPELGVNYS